MALDYDAWLLRDAEGPNTLRPRKGTGRMGEIRCMTDTVECPACDDDGKVIDEKYELNGKCEVCKGECYVTRLEAEQWQRDNTETT